MTLKKNRRKIFEKTIIEWLVGLPVTVGVFTLFDYLTTVVFGNGVFVFDISNIIYPIVIWTIFEIITLIQRMVKKNRQ